LLINQGFEINLLVGLAFRLFLLGLEEHSGQLMDPFHRRQLGDFLEEGATVDGLCRQTGARQVLSERDRPPTSGPD